MAQTSDDPAHRYANERARVKTSDLSESDTEAVLEFLAALDPDDLSATYTNEKGEQETLAHSSLQDYGRGLRLLADELDTDLASASIGDLRAGFDSMLKDLAKQTVRQRQAAARKFYRYHDCGIDPEQIPLSSVDTDSDVDERTTLTEEDIQALREATDNARDRAMLELFVYTGQRLRAVQTLRIQDIDLEEEVYYLNTEEAGLKDADKVGGKRPLLGATKAVREWINNHPTGEPEDYLITSLPSASATNGPGEYLTKIAIYNRLDKLFREADVDKPDGQMAHAFRHYFVTVCYRDYGMDPSTIKHLIGHSDASTVMETTYKHLTDQDHVDDTRDAWGMGNDDEDGEEEGNAFTPPVCPTCDEPLPSTARACESCGMVFSPDAKAAQDRVGDEAEERKEEAESLGEYKLLDQLERAAREDPERVAELLGDITEDEE